MISAAAPGLRFGGGFPASEETLGRLVGDGVAGRLFAKDPTLWGPDAEAEARVRLGWIDAVEQGDALIAEVEELRDALASAGIDRVVLCGMGGSSLAPEMIARRDWAPLVVLDSSHPDQVRRALAELPRTMAVISSKSGSTVETLSQLAVFEAAFDTAGIDAAERIVVVTDPGSALEERARRSGYRVFLADPEVGGRYSALTAFGLVPSVLAGADCRAVLAEARAAAPLLRSDSAGNPALRLAAAIASVLPERYLCCIGESQVQGTHLAEWIEQLIAESTGKLGRGVLPMALPADAPELCAPLPAHAFAVDLAPSPGSGALPQLTAEVSGPLGAQFLLWEVTTAVLGRLIGVDPFDQPDVESAKAAARELLAADGAASRPVEPLLSAAEALEALRSAVDADGYVAIQAFLDRATAAPLAELRAGLAETLGIPVALGFGPRYLHSTGQFHKGGPQCGVFLQVLDATLVPGADDAPVDLAALIGAQARGDRQVLEAQGRPVFAIAETEVAPLVAAIGRNG